MNNLLVSQTLPKPITSIYIRVLSTFCLTYRFLSFSLSRALFLSLSRTNSTRKRETKNMPKINLFIRRLKEYTWYANKNVRMYWCFGIFSHQFSKQNWLQFKNTYIICYNIQITLKFIYIENLSNIHYFFIFFLYVPKSFAIFLRFAIVYIFFSTFFY